MTVTDTDWAAIEQNAMVRSGACCEIQSPECLGAYGTGWLGGLPRWKRSLHHRRPRGMGGTQREDVDSYAMLVNTCGHGSIGCHRFAEIHRTWAFARGLLIPKVGTDEVTNPARVPLVLPSGRRVLIDEYGPFYNPPEDGVHYVLRMPDMPGV